MGLLPSSSYTPDASSTAKGKLQLTGDLGNTAASPQVTNLHLSADTSIGHKLTNVTDPGSAQDAATKNYVDNHPTGGQGFLVAASNAPSTIKARADYICDGTADNVEIQAAIDAVATNGGSVILSTGTFTLAAKLQITHSHTSLIGQGNATILTLANSVNDNVLNITGSGVIEVKIRDLRIDGNKANQTNGDGIYLSTLWTSGTNDTQHTFTDIQVLNCKNNGIEVAASSDTRVLQFTRVRVRKCDGNGWYLPAPSCTDCTFYDCIAETIALNGFYVGCLNSHFTDCKTFYCGSAGGNNHGFYIAGYNNYFNQCEAQDNYQSGFYSQNDGDATYGTQRNTLIGCIADSNGQNGGTTYACGLQLKNCSHWLIIGGIYMTRPYPSFTQRIGISLEGTTADIRTIGAQGTGNSSAFYSDTSSGTNYPMWLDGFGQSTPSGDIMMGTNKIKLGDGTPYISGSGLVMLIDGANNSIRFQNFAEIFLNATNPNLQLFNASDQTLNIINGGGGKANLSVNNNIRAVAGGLQTTYVAKTATYTITASDSIINCTSGTFTVTLPTAVGIAGREYVIKNSGAGIITVATTSSQTIDGASSYTIVTQSQSITVASDGVNWIITKVGGDSIVPGSRTINGHALSANVTVTADDVLPSQTGNSGKFLTTNGSSASWGTVTGGSGITRSINSISANTTAGSSASVDYVYFVSSTTTLTLPSAVSNTNRYTVKNVGSNTVTVATTSAQTIDGSSSITLPVANTSVDIISDNTNWRVV